MSKEQIVRDLSSHLDDRIHTVLQDYAERCRDAQIDVDTARAFALTVLGVHTTVLAIDAEATEAEFVNLCRWHFYRGRQALRDA